MEIAAVAPRLMKSDIVVFIGAVESGTLPTIKTIESFTEVDTFPAASLNHTWTVFVASPLESVKETSAKKLFAPIDVDPNAVADGVVEVSEA